MVMSGAFLSTMLPLIGPAMTQLPATSQICRLSVKALAVSVPDGTMVDRVKLASPGLARPDSASLAVHWRLTSLACHWPSGAAHVNVGATLSKHNGPYFAKPPMPRLSQAR